MTRIRPITKTRSIKTLRIGYEIPFRSARTIPSIVIVKRELSYAMFKWPTDLFIYIRYKTTNVKKANIANNSFFLSFFPSFSPPPRVSRVIGTSFERKFEFVWRKERRKRARAASKRKISAGDGKTSACAGFYFPKLVSITRDEDKKEREPRKPVQALKYVLRPVVAWEPVQLTSNEW